MIKKIVLLVSISFGVNTYAMIELNPEFTFGKKCERQAVGLEWSPDGKCVAVSRQGKELDVYDVSTGKREFFTVPYDISSFSFSRDGSRIAIGTERGKVHLLDVIKKEIDGTASCNFNSYEDSDVASIVAWSPDGSRIAHGITADSSPDIILWDADVNLNDQKKSTAVSLLGHEKGITALAWKPSNERDPNESILASGSDARIIIWNVAEKLPIKYLDGHMACIFSIVWSFDGAQIVSNSSQELDNLIKVWNVEDEKLEMVIPEPVILLSRHSLSPEGFLYCGSNSENDEKSRLIGIWDLKKKQFLGYFKNNQKHSSSSEEYDLVSCSPNGKKIASAGSDNTIKIWAAWQKVSKRRK